MLVCKCCGYKQYDEECIAVFKALYPEYEEHDIPYYCGACQDNIVQIPEPEDDVL